MNNLSDLEKKINSELTTKINDSNKEPLSDVNIVVVDKNIGAATDDNGFFQLKLPNEISSFTLQASAIGFASISKNLESEKANNIVVFQLVPKIIELDHVFNSFKKAQGSKTTPLPIMFCLSSLNIPDEPA